MSYWSRPAAGRRLRVGPFLAIPRAPGVRPVCQSPGQPPAPCMAGGHRLW